MDIRIAFVLERIHHDPATSISLLAAAVHLSPSRLRHLFRIWTTRGLGDYLRRERLAQAEGLLSRSFLSVKEICATCGFGTPAHFTRQFRSAYGLPPAAYRASRRRYERCEGNGIPQDDSGRLRTLVAAADEG